MSSNTKIINDFKLPEDKEPIPTTNINKYKLPNKKNIKKS